MKTSSIVLLMFAAAAVLFGCSGAPFTAADLLATTDAGATADVGTTLAADTNPAPGKDGSSGGSSSSSSGGSSSSSGGEAGSVHEEGGVMLDARAGASNAADAQGEAGDAASSCADDLSHVGAGDFHIEFDVVGIAGGGPLVEQRSTCGQYDVHWLIAETASANIITQFYDGSTGPQLQSVATLSDGVRHHVAVARVALLFSITIDGQLDSSVASAVWAPPTLPLLLRSLPGLPQSGA